MKCKQILSGLALSLGLILSSSGANATLIDHTSYTTDTTFGLDWLDLSATAGQSVASALSSNSGWSYANNTQVSNLLSSFGITYVFTAGIATSMSPTVPQVTNFQSLFGVTGGSGYTLGGYFNGAVGHSTYLCISNNICGLGGSFTNDVDLSGGNGIVGVFLVRSSETVPEPATLALLALGLLGLGFSRRKQA